MAVHLAAGANPIGYGSGATCGVNGLACLDATRHALEACLANPAASTREFAAIAESDSKVDMLTQHAEDYVTKPFHYEELVARIRRVLGRLNERIP